MFGFTRKASRKASSSSNKTGPIVFDIAPHHGDPTRSCDIMIIIAKERYRNRKASYMPFTSRERDALLAQSKCNPFETYEDEKIDRRHGKIPLASVELAERFEMEESAMLMRAMLREEIRC